MRRPFATGEGYSGARWSRDQRRDGDSEEPANAESDAQDERPVDGDGCKGVAGAMRQHRARGTVCRAAADVIGMLEAPPHATHQIQDRAELHRAVAQLGDECLLLTERSRHWETSIGTARQAEKDKLVTPSRYRCSLSRMLRARHPFRLRPGMGGSGRPASAQRELSGAATPKLVGDRKQVRRLAASPNRHARQRDRHRVPHLRHLMMCETPLTAVESGALV